MRFRGESSEDRANKRGVPCCAAIEKWSRSSILATFHAVGAITYEAIRSLGPRAGGRRIVMIVATIGIVVPGVTAWIFVSGRNGDINIRGAYLHMAADADVAAGVVVADLAITLGGFLLI